MGADDHRYNSNEFLSLNDFFDSAALTPAVQPESSSTLSPTADPNEADRRLDKPVIRYEHFTQRQLAFYARAIPQRILILIDGDFSKLHNEKNLTSLTRQLMTCCNVAGRVDKPCMLCVSDLVEDIIDAKRVNIDTMLNSEAFALRIGKFVYLTADAEEALSDDHFVRSAATSGPLLPKSVPEDCSAEREIDVCFIIGGMIDRNSWKGRCKTKADDLCVDTAKLPLKSNATIGNKKYCGSKVLTCDQGECKKLPACSLDQSLTCPLVSVTSILQYKVNGMSWDECFLNVIPNRHFVAK